MKTFCTITGGTGFIGQNLSAYLKQRNRQCELLSRMQLGEIDKLNFNNTETIIHLAGKAHDLKKTANPREYYQVNFELTKKLYDAFLASDAKKFIFISSVKAAANQIDGVLTEEMTPSPETDYGWSKLMAEQYILSQPLPEGKSYYILRPCMTHGRGNKGNLNLLYKIIKNGLPYPLAAFENKRSFTSIQNMCFIINEIAVREDIPLGIYQVADDEPLSTTEVVAILAKSTNKSGRVINLSQSFVRFIAKVGDIFRLPLTSERLGKLTENYIVSNAKIKAAIDKPLPVSVRAGLKFTAESFNNQEIAADGYQGERLEYN
jgi:nucleoside-diphosphate-sugar epimerase